MRLYDSHSRVNYIHHENFVTMINVFHNCSARSPGEAEPYVSFPYTRKNSLSEKGLRDAFKPQRSESP